MSPRPRSAPPSRSSRSATAGTGAELGDRWTVGPKAHGGLLLVLLARAALARLDADAPGLAPDPLAIAADFLRAPDPGPVTMTTEVLKTGRTASVVVVRMHQDDRLMLSASVTAGRLPDAEPRWSEAREQPVEPPAEAINPAAGATVFGLAHTCDLRFDPATMAFLRREQAPPVLRGWARTRDEPVDVLFALLAGDILPADRLQPRWHARLGPDRAAHRAAAGPPRAGLAAGRVAGRRRRGTVVRRGRHRGRRGGPGGLPGPPARAGPVAAPRASVTRRPT